MTDAADTTDKFTLKITGPGMSFDRDIDPAIIASVIQLALGGNAAAPTPPPPPWEPADPRVDLDGSDDDAQPKKAVKKAPKKAAKKAGQKASGGRH